jgi:hypothetical protein
VYQKDDTPVTWYWDTRENADEPERVLSEDKSTGLCKIQQTRVGAWDVLEALEFVEDNITERHKMPSLRVVPGDVIIVSLVWTKTNDVEGFVKTLQKYF